MQELLSYITFGCSFEFVSCDFYYMIKNLKGSSIFNIAYIHNYLHSQPIEKVFLKWEMPFRKNENIIF